MGILQYVISYRRQRCLLLLTIWKHLVTIYAAPHIVVFVADDLGWNDVSFHGSPQILTPNIDHLADIGINLNNYYVSPICTPSRGALMTGMHPIHLGLQHDVIHAAEPWGLPLNVRILPEYLKDLGYMCHAIGKWHLGYFSEIYTPTYRGFDSHYGYWTGRKDYYDHTVLEGPGWGIDMRNGTNLVKDALGQYTTDLFTQRATAVIREHNASQPLFLMLAHLAVHAANSYQNLQAPEKYVNRFPHIKDPRRRIFAGMVSALDDSIGEVLEALDNARMLDNTIFIMTTDNGGAAGGVDESIGSNWPLRGSKYTLWEGGVRGTAIIWSPLIPSKSRTSNNLMHVSDWLPTLYQAAGGEVKDLGDIYGMSMWDCLCKELPSPRKEVLHNIDPVWNVAALRNGNFKLVSGTVFDGHYDGWYEPPGSNNEIFPFVEDMKKWAFSLRIFSKQPNVSLFNRWKPRAEVECGRKPENASSNCNPVASPCLYNIVLDPCEFNNIAREFPQVLSGMMQRLSELNRTAVPPLNVQGDQGALPHFWDYSWTNWKDKEKKL